MFDFYIDELNDILDLKETPEEIQRENSIIPDRCIIDYKVEGNYTFWILEFLRVVDNIFQVKVIREDKSFLSTTAGIYGYCSLTKEKIYRIRAAYSASVKGY